MFSSEFAYLSGRNSTWLYVVVLLVFTLLMNGITTPGDGVFPNNSFHITAVTVMGGLIWLLIGASIAGEAAARDVQMRIHPLVYTTPVKKLDYLCGKFLAALALNALLVLALPLGVLISFHLPGMNHGEFLPFRPSVYLNVYFLIALPNALIATALQFTFAVLGRQVMASYIASLLLAIFPQMIAISAANLLGNWDILKLLDPIGIAGIIGSELQTWTATEKNTRLIALEGIFLWNRILWLGMAIGSLWLTWYRFNFTDTVTNRWWSRFSWWPYVKAKAAPQATIINATAISVPRSFSYTTFFYQTLMIAWASFVKIAKHPLGLTLVGAICLGSALFGNRIIAEFGIPILPTTQQVVGFLTAPAGSVHTPWVVIPLLIMYFVGDLVWQERETGLSEIADAAPVPDWVLLTGKLLGLGLILSVWLALLMTGGILMQLYQGYDQLEVGLYVRALFGHQLVDYLLFALLSLVVHVVVNQKHIGYLVVLLIFSFMAFPSRFGIEHPMLIFGADPGWWYTDMRGFGPTLVPWLWFKAYWLSWALLLAVAARLLWARGREQSLKRRLQLAQRRFTPATTLVALMGLGLLLTLGSFLYYQMNVLSEYLTVSDRLERKAEYERRYGRYRNAPQPHLTATRLHVELYPDRQRVDIQAGYTLVNKDTVSIDSIHVGNVLGSEFSEVHFNRTAAGVLLDKELNHFIYRLEQPLRPGDSLQLSFVVQDEHQGFQPRSTKALVVEEGTYFTNSDMLPAIGYQYHREINDAIIRKKHQLAARPAIPSLDDRQARKKPFSTDQTTFEAIIGTVRGEVAVAPGVLRRTWTEAGRRYFHYQTKAPIGGEYAILSGKYAVRESQWHGVAIRIYHYPGHAQHIDRMLRSVKASLEYYSTQFDPYPYEYLTVVERAGPGGGASADAGIIYYGEQYALMKPDDGPDGFALPYYILAHEVAHQWWGLARLTPAYVEGAGVLIEGLAVFSGMQVLEKSHGEDHLRKYVGFLHDSYSMPRSRATATLLRANEEFLYYRKGGLALYALSEYIGKGKVNGALRRLLRKHSSGELPLPTTLDLYQELQNVTPDSLHYLLDDLFEKNTYWRLKTQQVKAKHTKEDSWQVMVRVQVQKIVVDGSGHEREVPMNDWLEIGLYEEGKGPGEPLYLRMHRVRSGGQTIQVTVPRKPARGGIDPNFLMIDLRLEDNMRQVDEG